MQLGTQLLVEEGRQCWSEDEGHQGEAGRLGRVAAVLVADAVIDLDLEFIILYVGQENGTMGLLKYVGLGIGLKASMQN